MPPVGRPRGRVLWREALVVVVVADEDQVGAGLVEGVPKVVIRRIVAVLAGREARVVPHRGEAARAGWAAGRRGATLPAGPARQPSTASQFVSRMTTATSEVVA